MIGTGGGGSASSGGGESTSPEPPSVKPTAPSVVFRNNTSPFGQRPQSMFGGEKISPTTRPFYMTTGPPNTISLTVEQWTELNEKV